MLRGSHVSHGVKVGSELTSLNMSGEFFYYFEQV